MVDKENKEDQLMIVGGFFENLEVWQAILDDCALVGGSLVGQYLSQPLHWVHFQLLIGGDWHQLAKIETSLKAHKKNLKAEAYLDWQREEYRLDNVIRLPYVFEVDAPVSIALFDLLIHFIRAEPRIEIKEIWSDRYLQGKTAVPMQKINIRTHIAFEVNLPELRENFMIFCEQYNVDGMFELERN